MKKESELNEIRITVPEGMEIDKENSTFECIKFKKKEGSWISIKGKRVNGFYISTYDSKINNVRNMPYDEKVYSMFATEKQAKSALAMAQISQIVANDERFGGVVTDEEWDNMDTPKYVILRDNNNIFIDNRYTYYKFLAFHTKEQRNLFLEENEDLVKQYLMID